MGKGSTSLRFLSWIRIVVPIFSYGSPTPIFPIISLAVASRSEISYTDGAQHRHGIVVCGIGLGFCGDYENGNRCRDAQKRHFYAHAGHCDDVVRHVVSNCDQLLQPLGSGFARCARTESHATSHVPQVVEPQLDEHSSLSQW